MSTDASIRRISIAEQAEAAARLFMETGSPQANPHAGMAGEQVWRSVYERWCLALSAAADTEGSA